MKPGFLGKKIDEMTIEELKTLANWAKNIQERKKIDERWSDYKEGDFPKVTGKLS